MSASRLPARPLARADVERYSRQLLLPGFDEAHERLRSARVLIVGLGGLGTPLATYLAGAGVGALTLSDGDTVGLSNLQRQTLYATPDVGREKTAVAAARLQALNPGVRLDVRGPLTPEGATDLVGDHDLVVDASDNFASRYLVSDTCAALGRRWVWGAAGGYEGMTSVFGPDLTLRHVFPEPDAAGDDCDTIGVLGPLLGVVASTMAVEALKLLGGIGTSLYGTLWLYDALAGRVRHVDVRRARL